MIRHGRPDYKPAAHKLIQQKDWAPQGKEASTDEQVDSNIVT